MALIKCPECGHDVSTFASTCPNCGYPMAQATVDQEKNNATVCKINGREFDISDIMPLIGDPGQKILAIKMLQDMSGIGLADAKKIIETLETKADGSALQFSAKNSSVSPTQVQCPTCHSTSVTKLTVGSRLIDGFFFDKHSVEGRAQFRCDKCGYMW